MSERLTQGDEDLIRKRSAIGLPVEFWHVESMLAEIDALRRELADEKAERHALKALLDSGKVLESQLAEAKDLRSGTMLTLQQTIESQAKTLAATKAVLQKVRHALKLRVLAGHNDTCQLLVCGPPYLCNCGHNDCVPALAEIDKLEGGR